MRIWSYIADHDDGNQRGAGKGEKRQRKNEGLLSPRVSYGVARTGPMIC